ncbi:MAG: thymidine kinase [Oligoflexus sp.]
MAKLYFRYGTVGSAKTMNLLAVAHNYRHQNKSVLLLKPKLDTRFGLEFIKSRSGLTMEADILLAEDSDLKDEQFLGVHCVLVDEVQFLSPQLIERLRAITRTLDIPVICYGLRTDFRTQLFPGSKRLMEMADSIEEVKTTCGFCNRKAVFNLKFSNGQPTMDGPTVDLGADEKYLPACSICYFEQIEHHRHNPLIFSQDSDLKLGAEAPLPDSLQGDNSDSIK